MKSKKIKSKIKKYIIIHKVIVNINIKNSNIL